MHLTSYVVSNGPTDKIFSFVSAKKHPPPLKKIKFDPLDEIEYDDSYSENDNHSDKSSSVEVVVEVHDPPKDSEVTKNENDKKTEEDISETEEEKPKNNEKSKISSESKPPTSENKQLLGKDYPDAEVKKFCYDSEDL